MRGLLPAPPLRCPLLVQLPIKVRNPGRGRGQALPGAFISRLKAASKGRPRALGRSKVQRWEGNLGAVLFGSQRENTQLRLGSGERPRPGWQRRRRRGFRRTGRSERLPCRRAPKEERRRSPKGQRRLPPLSPGLLLRRPFHSLPSTKEAARA